MMNYPFNFDYEKAIETIIYIVVNGSNPTFSHVLKVIYFADKDHLDKYGRFICGDNYIAMKNGPVPSGVYDLLKYARGELPFIALLPDPIKQQVKNSISVYGNYNISVLRQPDIDIFSDSDIECLNKSIVQNGKLPFDILSKASHDNIWNSAKINDSIEIEYFLSNMKSGDELREHFCDQYPGENL